MSDSINVAVIVHGAPTVKQIEVLKRTVLEENDSVFFLNDESLLEVVNSDRLDRIKFIPAYADWQNAIGNCDKAIFLGMKGEIADEKSLNSLFSSRAKSVIHITENGGFSAFPEVSGEGEKLLFIFPGSIVPLNSGSHQRAFNLLFNLRKNGYSIDALITKPKNSNEQDIVSSLRVLCSNVFLYKNKSRKIPEPLSTYRWVEQRINIIKGKGKVLPDTFQERALLKPTESAQRWVNSLFLHNRYRKIIVSYAWMLDVIKYIDHQRSEFKLICDTHDVQYVRNEALLNRGVRPFFSRSRDRRAELSRLEKCDAVLAISVSDEEILTRDLKSPKVVRATPGFDYALLPVKRRPPERPYCFGFIGGRMEANKKALDLILNEWWPKIKEYSPDSILYVAGSISLEPEVSRCEFFDRNVVSLGFVDNLQSFYSKIDVSLNPVVAQGGLNFKSVEAVFSGKHLITNGLGKECLGEGFPAFIASSGLDVVNIMKKYEYSLDSDRKIRLSAQKQAKTMFQNIASFEKLLAYLDSDFK